MSTPTKPFDPSGYATVAFLDTNIILQGRALAQLPWGDLDPTGPILALIPMAVLQEVDGKKSDGRLGKHARAFNRLVAPAALGKGPVRVHDEAPIVDLAVSSAKPIAWQTYDDLDRDDGDGRIIAEILNVRDLDPMAATVISHDLKPLALASAHGLKVLHVSDDWLRPPEPSPYEKDMQRMKARVRELEATQPAFTVEIAIADEPWTVLRVEDLDADGRERLWNKLFTDAEPDPESHAPYGFSIDQDYSYGDRWDRFIDKTLPAFADQYARKIELIYNQFPVTLHVRNSGQISADNLTIEARVQGGWFNDRPIFVSPAGPPAPRRRGMLDNIPYLGEMISQVGRHEFEWLQPPKRAGAILSACEDFRHEQDWVFGGFIGLDARAEEPFSIQVKVRAKNMNGAVIEDRVIAVTRRQAVVSDLVDLEALTLREPAPLVELVMKLVQEEDGYELIDWDG